MEFVNADKVVGTNSSPMSKQYVIRRQHNSSEYEILIKKPIMSLLIVRKRLESIGYTIKLDQSFIIIAQKEFEINVFPSGRILVKGKLEPEVLGRVADEICAVI